MSPELIQEAFDAVADNAETQILKIVDALVDLDDAVLATGVKVEQEITPDFGSFEPTDEGFEVDVEVETTVTPIAVVTADVVAGLAALKILSRIKRDAEKLGSDWLENLLGA